MWDLHFIKRIRMAKAIMDALDEAITITKDCPYWTTIHTDQGWGYQMKAL